MVERVDAADQDLRQASLQELEALTAITFAQQSRQVDSPRSVRLITHWSSYRLTREIESCSAQGCDEPAAQARRSGPRTARNQFPSPTVVGMPLFPITRVPFDSHGVIVSWDRVHSMRR